jgi:type II secretory pathway component PulK
MNPYLPPKPAKGSAMLAVIWLIAVIGLATLAAVRVMKFDVQVATAKIHGSRARQVAEMGVAVAANPVVKRTDPLLRWTNESADEGYEAHILSEGGRFNINSILLQGDKEFMSTILNSWGIDQKDAQAITDELIDWVDADNNVSLTGAEEEEYLKAGRINQPFNRPFYNINEARLVRGMDLVEAARPDWRDWFTVWSSGPLDLNEAPAELIAVAAECEPEQAAIIPETVRGPDGERDTLDDVPFQNAAAALDLLGISANDRPDIARRFSVNDSTTRIESLGQAAGAKRKITLILRNRTGKPALLERYEEIIP